jgi:uncharacterized membrane protein YhaH (DUF805 family)
VSSLSIQRLRERLPLIVFLFLFVVLLMLVGIACACTTDHPMQALERVTSAAPAIPAVIEIWVYAIATLLVAAFVLPQRSHAFGRASPAALQRFLF